MSHLRILAGLTGCLCLAACGGSSTPSSSPTSSRVRTGDDLYVLHGLWSDPDAMSDLIKTVSALGIYKRVFAIGYRDDQSIRVTGRELATVVRATSGSGSCDFVGHSLGGLVVRWALEQEGLGRQAHKAWLLGTPNLGSTLAQWWPAGGAVDDLKPGSETLRVLNSGPRVTDAAYSYLTIAGNLIIAGRDTQSDGVVSVPIANWSGLGWRARALTRSVVRCSHFGLKSDPVALRQLVAMIRVQSTQP